ncbi:MAG: hypothetical protein LWX07_13425, partial [Bacteroidetes bacterium]|nr:hypothetical protein [Bacteroidota bacterium]
MKIKISFIPALLLAASVIGVSAGFIKKENNAEEKAINKIENFSLQYASVNGLDTAFFIGAYGFGYNSTWNNYADPYNWAYHTKYIRDSLRLNNFVFFSDASMHPPDDGGLEDTLLLYKQSVQHFMEYMNGDINIQNGFYERRTIKTLCEAQRSTYETEDSVKYGFRNDITPKTGNIYGPDGYGASGRWAQYGANSPGYLVSGLIVNGEQSDNYKFCGAGPRDDSIWYVKPRMRIDSADVYRLYDSVIARIEIYNFEGDTCKTINMTGKNFVFGNPYNGRYIEEFNFYNNPNPLAISGDMQHLNKGAVAEFDSTYHIRNCKVDYRIWWTGRCNLWVDYVRLDDFRAHQLFKTGSNYYIDKLDQEINAFKDKAFIFYEDEIRYNNIPALKLVSERIKSITGTPANFAVLAFPSINGAVYNTALYNNDRSALMKQFLDSVSVRYLLGEAYPVCTKGDDGGNTDFFCYYPPNLSSAANCKQIDFLKASSSYVYTNAIQQRFGANTGNYDITQSMKSFSYTAYLNKMSEIANTRNLPMISSIQAHSLLKINSSNKLTSDFNLREPTNEEIGAMTFMALCYGSKGIIYFDYPGMNVPLNAYDTLSRYLRVPFYLKDNSNLSDYLIFEGITMTQPGQMAEPVISNHYNQNKFHYIALLNEKIRQLGPRLMKLRHT